MRSFAIKSKTYLEKLTIPKMGVNKRQRNESVYRFSFAYGSYKSSQT